MQFCKMLSDQSDNLTHSVTVTDTYKLIFSPKYPIHNNANTINFICSQKFLHILAKEVTWN